jgi:hypothetical protein
MKELRLIEQVLVRMKEFSLVEWFFFAIAVVLFIYVISQIPLMIADRREQQRIRGITTDPFKVWQEDGVVKMITNAGSWVDYGLRHDTSVPGIERITLEGRDRDQNMILRMSVDKRRDPERIARKISALHSVRMNPTTDWTDRDDMDLLCEED